MAQSPFAHVITSSIMLGLFGVVGAGIVAGVHELTAERVLENERQARLRVLNEVLPADRYDNSILADTLVLRDPALADGRYPVTVYRARRGEAPVAAVFETVAPDGYSGAIHLLIGIDTDGRVTGARVLKHAETPGLGDPIEQNHSNWILGFTGKSTREPELARWAVKRDGGEFDQFTGATISPRAVVKAIRQTLVYFGDHRDQLLATETPIHE
ncbi:MAG: electron transport complex subunit RsxG [Thiotrichales bacterium]